MSLIPVYRSRPSALHSARAGAGASYCAALALTGALFLSTLKTDRWRPAVVASALWAVVALVGGVIYPATIQSLVVNPNQRDKEAQYIAYNITATRDALGIADVTVQPIV